MVARGPALYAGISGLHPSAMTTINLQPWRVPTRSRPRVDLAPQLRRRLAVWAFSLISSGTRHGHLASSYVGPPTRSRRPRGCPSLSAAAAWPPTSRPPSVGVTTLQEPSDRQHRIDAALAPDRCESVLDTGMPSKRQPSTIRL